MAGKRERIIRLIARTTGAKELKDAEATLRRIENEVKQANSALRKMGKSAQAATSAYKLLGTAVTAIGLGRTFSSILQATVEQERVVAQLNQTLESTQGAAGRTSRELQEYASTLQDLTTYGDEAVIAAEAMLLTFTNIRDVTFDRTMRAVLDLSTAMGQDLKASVLQLGKALNDPVKGLSALSETGIQFSASQKSVIARLQEMGRTAEAQSVILEELERQFGGSAEAARNTLGGALAGLKNAWGDLFEVDPKGLTDTVDSINELNEIITSPEFKDAVQTLAKAVIDIAGGAADTVKTIVGLTEFLGESAAAMMVGPEFDDEVRRLERIAELREEVARMEARSRGKGPLSDARQELKYLEAQQRLFVVVRREQREINRLKREAAAIPAPPSAPDEPGAQVVPALAEVQGPSKAVLARVKEYEAEVRRLNEQQRQRDTILRALHPEEMAHKAAVEQAAEAYTNGAIGLDTYQKRLAQIRDESKFMQEAIGDFERLLIEGIDRNLDTMLAGVLQGTQSVKDGIKDMVKVMIAELAKLAAFKGIMSLFGGTSFGAAFGEITGVTAFAKGGVLSGPVAFPMATGIGVMAERGPEAILPVARNGAGELGVKGQPLNVTINNHAPGVDVQASQDGAGGLTLEIVRRAIAADVTRGGSDLANAMTTVYGLRRNGS